MDINMDAKINGVSIEKSVTIYNHLMNGRMLNDESINADGEMVRDELFTEVIDNLGAYRNQYAMNGYNLNINSEFMYITKGQSHEVAKSDIAMKAYMLLLILGRYTTSRGYAITEEHSSNKLSSAKGGFSYAEIEKMETMPYVKEILDKSGMKDGLYRNVKTTLVDRSIMYIHPLTQNLVLTKAGNAFFDELVADMKAELDESFDDFQVLNMM